jgi:hypothetical protein
VSESKPSSEGSKTASSALAELDRITALPEREPTDCERLRDGSRRWAPEAQALVSFVTSRYAKPGRLSCACRDRYVERTGGDRLTVFHTPSPKSPPPVPTETTIGEFCADAEHDADAVRLVQDLRPGEGVKIPGLGHPFCVTELNPVQAWTLYELPRAGGVFGMVSVGGGKTFTGILAPLAMPNLPTWVILVKPDQRLHYRNAYLRLREHFRVPTFIFDRTDFRDRFIVPGAPVLHLIPYSVLSSTKQSLLLEQIDPDGIIADESHKLANKKASGTMRFLRLLKKRNAEKRAVVLCTWSGSAVKRSIKDCSHLSAFSLGMTSPYPIPDEAAEQWSAVIDPSVTPDTSSGTAAALYREFGKGNVPDDLDFLFDNTPVREGYRDRIVSTLGVISTKTSSITCSISISERKAPPLPKSVLLALVGVRADESVRPDGEILVEKTEQARVAREVASGFYNYWRFRPEDSDELIAEWKQKRKDWNRQVRFKLAFGEPHLDSPKNLENAAERAFREPRYDGELPVWPAESWPAWRDIKDRVPHEDRVRWIDDFLARDAAAWAAEHRGVVWCNSRAFAQKVAELSGLPYHGGGPDAEARILAEDGSRSIVASIKAHGTGRDGLQQKFSKQLIAEIPASADLWEQLLGRLAREGQQADTVETWIYYHVPEIRDAFRKAMMYAEFIEATTPNQQALLSADIDFDY